MKKIKRIKTRIRIISDEARLELSIAKYKLAEKEIRKSFLKLLIIISIILFLSNAISYFLTNPEDVLALIKSAKGFGPVIIILLIILEIIIAPLPGFILTVSSGYLYGSLLGGFYSYLGNILGSIMAFLLSKHYGRPFVEKIISHRLMLTYDNFFSKSRHYLLLLYAIPIIPVDILSFISGLSSLSLRRFILIITMGFIPNILLLSYFGEYLTRISIITAIIFLLLFIILFSLLSILWKLFIKKF